MRRSTFWALLSAALLACACSGGRRTDPLAGMGVSAPARDLALAYVYSENAEKSRAYLKAWRAGHAGADSDAIYSKDIPELLGRHFKSAAPAESLEKALASGADVVAVVDSWAEHGGFGLGHVQMSVKIIFLSRAKQEIEAVESKRRKEIGLTGITPAGPWAWGSAILSMEQEVRDDLESAIAASARLAEYEKSRAVRPTAQAIHSDVDAPSYKLPPNPENFAVVMGVEKYSALPEAQFAERDAQAVREHLVALGYPMRNIALLTGPQATKTGLAKNVETWLAGKVTERSTVFFYYSGHGSPALKTGQAYLVPVDGDPQYLEDTAYPLRRLYETLDALKAKRVIVAIDSCFSGAGGRSVLPKGTRPLVAKAELGVIGSEKVISLAASDGGQIAGTDESQGHGLFTYYLLKGLNGAALAQDGRVTVKSLFEYLAPNVADEAKRANRDQTPMLTAREPDQVVLRSK